MAAEPLRESKVAAFPATRLVPFLRAIADPEGSGKLTHEQARTIRQVEENVARNRAGE